MCGSCQVNELSANNALQTFHTRSFADILVIIIGIFCTRSLDFVCNCYARSIFLLKVIQDHLALHVVVKDNFYGKFSYYLTFFVKGIFFAYFRVISLFLQGVLLIQSFVEHHFLHFFSISQVQLQWIMPQQNHHPHHKPS